MKTQPNQFFGSGSHKKLKIDIENTIFFFFFLLTKQVLNSMLQLLDIYIEEYHELGTIQHEQ